MKTSLENNSLIIALPERVDSNNANEIGDELDSILANNNAEEVVLDASILKYISSAGLRIVLKCKKRSNDLKIINVSSEVYEIFEMTGFTEIIQVEKAYRVMSVDGCEIIGKGAKGTVYRYNNDTVLKVYNDKNSIDEIKNERKLAKYAFVLGIPTAISFDLVKVGDKFGTVYELLDAHSFSTIMGNDSSRVEECSNMYADVLRLIHSTEVSKDKLPNAKNKYDNIWLKSTLPYLNEEETSKVIRMLEEIPESNTMLHCDFHTNNLMLQNGEPIVIDMDTLSYGHPLYDLGNICFAYKTQCEFDPESAESFLGMKREDIFRVWKYFLPRYLKTSDEKLIEEVDKKITCFSFFRFINHLYKRSSDPMHDEKILPIVKEFRSLLNELDRFDW